uniref:Uncharacterized protein n=1 Tax=Heterosigma akashiwo TaxID=2829 RepID=A0A7S3XQJ1_HETAK
MACFCHVQGMKHASDHEEFHYHQQKAKQDNPLVLIKHSFNGLMARFHRVAMAFQDARRKAREQEYEEFEDMVHTNKSARTVEEKQADEEEAKRLKKKSYLHRQKVKLHHWLDQVGTIDRIEHILFIISFGKIKEIAILHPQYKQSGGQRLQQPKKSKKKTGIEPSYESESLVDDSTHHEGTNQDQGSTVSSFEDKEEPNATGRRHGGSTSARAIGVDVDEEAL